jgi:DnaJ-class molecular chaperone
MQRRTAGHKVKPCSVCGGKGMVPRAYYDRSYCLGAGEARQLVMCVRCKGKGVVDEAKTVAGCSTKKGASKMGTKE